MLTVAVGAQLLAIVLALAGPWSRFWADLAWFSLGAQWTALPTSALVCLARPALARLSALTGSVAVLAGLLLIAGTVHLVGSVLLGDAVRAASLARHLALTALVGGAVLRYLHLAYTARVRAAAMAQARLAALQARMQPHFLFNTLNTIAALTGVDPARAEQATEALAALLRATLGAPDSVVPLDDELALCRRYLDIEQLRLGDRLKVCWAVDDKPLGAYLPLLAVQPLVENAVRHGIEPLTEGGTVRICLGHDARRLWLEVDNPSPPGGAAAVGGARMALDNLRERLAVLYGPDAALRAEIAGQRYVARLEVPLERAR